MQLLKRIIYFLIGVSISSVGVYFFWQKKKATFDYGMDSRTLKTIRIKKRLFSEDANKVMRNSDIDSLKISTILFNGDVNFSKSIPVSTSINKSSIYRFLLFSSFTKLN